MKQEMVKIVVFNTARRLKGVNPARKIKRNFFSLINDKAPSYLDGENIKIGNQKSWFPNLIDYRGSIITIGEYFGKNMKKEEVVAGLLEQYYALNLKYSITNSSKFEFTESLPYEAKKELVSDLFRIFTSSLDKIKEEDRDKIVNTNLFRIPIVLYLKDSNFALSPKEMKIAESEEFADSVEKFMGDLTFYLIDSYEEIKILNPSASIQKEAITELRKYILARIESFKNLEMKSIKALLFNYLKVNHVDRHVSVISPYEIQELIETNWFKIPNL